MSLNEAELNRLRWRSRRGMLELDLLLLPFFEQSFESLPEDQQNTFIELLEQDDPDLLAWFSRKTRPEADNLAVMVDMILARVQPE